MVMWLGINSPPKFCHFGCMVLNLWFKTLQEQNHNMVCNALPYFTIYWATMENCKFYLECSSKCLLNFLIIPPINCFCFNWDHCKLIFNYLWNIYYQEFHGFIKGYENKYLFWLDHLVKSTYFVKIMKNISNRFKNTLDV